MSLRKEKYSGRSESDRTLNHCIIFVDAAGVGEQGRKRAEVKTKTTAAR